MLLLSPSHFAGIVVWRSLRSSPLKAIQVQSLFIRPQNVTHVHKEKAHTCVYGVRCCWSEEMKCHESLVSRTLRYLYQSSRQLTPTHTHRREREKIFVSRSHFLIFGRFLSIYFFLLLLSEEEKRFEDKKYFFLLLLARSLLTLASDHDSLWDRKNKLQSE